MEGSRKNGNKTAVSIKMGRLISWRDFQFLKKDPVPCSELFSTVSLAVRKI